MGDSKEISIETKASTTDATAASTTATTAQPRNWRRSYLWAIGLAFAVLVVLNVGLYLRLAAPIQTPVTDPAAPVTAASPPAVTAPAVTDGAAPVFAGAALAMPDSNNLLLTDTFAGGQGDSAWHAYSGEWVADKNVMTQNLPYGFDHGTVREGLFLNYSYAVTIQQLEGVGAGILFNVPNVDSKNGSHLVRFADDGSGIFWGHFDDQGAFTGQGYVATTAPGTAAHRLEVLSSDTAYAIKLDGAVVAQAIPLLSKSGHIGLLASQTVAAFSEVQLYAIPGNGTVDTTGIPVTAAVTGTVTGAEVITPSAVVTTSALTNQFLGENGVAFATISGDWIQEGNIISQNYMTATDFLVGTGVMAERYLLNATIQMTFTTALTDAGAGVVFHMPERDNKAGAQMVRFVDAGKGLSWGHFDEAGAFVGEGYSTLNLPPDEAHKLTLVAQGSTYDIFVNDKPVVQNLRTQNTGGFIGLTSYRGPNHFSNVELRIGNVVP